MTFKELKSKLEQFRGTKRRMKQLEEQISETRAMMDGVGTFRFDSVAVQGGQREPVQQRYIEHMERLLAVYKSLHNSVEEEVNFLENFLAERMQELTPLEQSMITDRYINGKSWRVIQGEYSYEQRQPFRIVNGALKKISDSAQHDTP